MGTTKQRILVAPLDWGLGHASRCIPLIRKWLLEGHEVVLAADGRPAALLAKEFPSLTMLPLNGYHIRYSATLPLEISLLQQLPKFLRAIRQEKAWLHELLQTEKFDLIVADNRYGLHHPSTYNILITHQLFVQVPRSLFFLTSLIHNRMIRWIKRFDECWIPDEPGELSLSGALSQKGTLPANARFIGRLSRFPGPIQIAAPAYEHVILLSGPEPQRTLLENLLRQEAESLSTSTLIVQGRPELEEDFTRGHLRTVSHLDDTALASVLQHAQHITCRSGYSTLMDLLSLGCKATLIPTPGQTEQLYLAHRMKELYGWPVRYQG